LPDLLFFYKFVNFVDVFHKFVYETLKKKTMKILKSVLKVLVALVLLVLVAAIFMKKEYAVEREITINKPRAEVFEYVRFLKHQDNFSVWNMKDPNQKKEYRGTDGTVGSVAGWDSQMDDVGKGEQEIKAIEEGARIDMELRFIRPFEATDKAYFLTTDAGQGQTKVQWGFNGAMPYPMNIMLPFMNMEEMLGGDLENGLKNLKNILEKN
jgi:uncharacterized protein YndB with AHSA1/START domain